MQAGRARGQRIPQSLGSLSLDSEKQEEFILFLFFLDLRM